VEINSIAIIEGCIDKPLGTSLQKEQPSHSGRQTCPTDIAQRRTGLPRRATNSSEILLGDYHVHTPMHQ
jgi:hypothetical protein